MKRSQPEQVSPAEHQEKKMKLENEATQSAVAGDGNEWTTVEKRKDKKKRKAEARQRVRLGLCNALGD
jgi:hypothetical protein